MRRSTTRPTPQISEWTEEKVHQWLTTEVKVSESCANRFTEEEVSGDFLVAFTKADILDLGIKHGPAVKIISYLESLKDGSQRKEFPAFAECWTKEQVNQWLLQHVNVYNKYAEKLLEEDVSGDCLVCFKKQDFLDLGVKNGPTVKILDKLNQLSGNPEPTLQPVPQTSSGQKEPPNPGHLEESPAQAAASNQSEPNKPENKDLMGAKESGRVQPQYKKEPKEKDIHQQKTQNVKAVRTETETAGLSRVPSVTVVIQETLEALLKEDLEKFQFYLLEFSKQGDKSIPRSKLENKDTMRTAELITDCYGSEEALTVTIKTLKNIKQNDLAHQLEIKTGRRQQQRPSEVVPKKEANQGDKLKNLLTCGGNSLGNYDNFVIVVNKSSADQVQYLQFLNKLKLFCVLDFDPDSNAAGGLCHSYRDSRWANLHTPSQYQGQIDSVIKDLNLSRQTSWVFCNGRHDLDGYKELNYWDWLRDCCSDVEQIVSFVCNPEVLLHERSLMIFLLLSPVDSEEDPIFETYGAFVKKKKEETIIHICESQSTYEKWRGMIHKRYRFNPDPLSVSELSLSEINGTIMALGPFSESSERLLPSTDSSFVVLKNKDEDLLTALDVLCTNQCENIYEDNSSEFHTKKREVEEEFYRGGKVKWWNFFFCDKDKQKPFIKRDKYGDVKKMIKRQLRESKDLCTLLNLFHNPGCGGTTLAMHVMWALRKEIRCAVLKDNKLPVTEVAVQVVKLMKLESEKPCPVLLLVDDSKETENPYELVNCIAQAVATYSNIDVGNAQSCKVIIFNCVRSHNPKEQYKRASQPSQFITASLTPGEQEDFEKKLKDLKETHEKPENFYSFMIMKSNFDKKYVEDLAHNTLESFDFSSKKDQLFAFIALLNTYEAESEISCSLCEDFLGMKKICWQNESALDRMEPYSNFLIIERVEDWGAYKGIRILHYSIASACLDELERRYSLKVSDITLGILHCDLFFSRGVVKQRLMDSIQRMLILRQLKKDGVERELFSPLINELHRMEGRKTVQQVFEKASSRFEKSVSIPQALARYLYITERDFPEALKWAEKAKQIKGSPYTLDTIGQIHKSNLKSNIQRERQETSNDPENLSTNLKMAMDAITAFKKAQELANTEDEPQEETFDDESDDFPRKSYNVKGYVGFLEIAFQVFKILSTLPFFEESDPMKRTYFQSFLKNTIPITSVNQEDNETNRRYKDIIKGHEYFLQNLKMETKETFELLDCYFKYIKWNNSEFQSKNHRIVCGLFTEYVKFFCPEPEETKREQQNHPHISSKIKTEQKRLYLERNQADTFSGILQHLDKPDEEIEKITECYAFLQQQQQQQQHINRKQKIKETINYILSNIILYLLKPNSKHVKSQKHLSGLLSTTLQDVGLGYPFPDPYYLALLLFWPSQTEENAEILTYVRAIRNSSHKQLRSLFRKRSTVAYLYLGKETGLKRLVSKPQLDKNFKISRETLAQLWRTGDIFREKRIVNCLQRVRGTIEQGEVFAHYGKLKISVRPAHIGHVTGGHSTEKVSFYLGFAINGPLAYDIQYEN